MAEEEYSAIKIPEKCPLCGGRLKYVGGGEYKCIRCYRTQMDDYGKVRDYMYKHGAASTADIAAATGVSKQVLVELLKSGKIELLADAGFLLNCERCQRPIRTGKLCERCQRFVEEVEKYKQESLKPKPVPRIKRGAAVRTTQAGRMRYWDRDRNDDRNNK